MPESEVGILITLAELKQRLWERPSPVILGGTGSLIIALGSVNGFIYLGGGAIMLAVELVRYFKDQNRMLRELEVPAGDDSRQLSAQLHDGEEVVLAVFLYQQQLTYCIVSVKDPEFMLHLLLTFHLVPMASVRELADDGHVLFYACSEMVASALVEEVSPISGHL